MKKRLADIGIMLFTTFIMLLICELFVRFFYPQILAPVKFSFDKEIGLRHVPFAKGAEYYPDVYDFSFENGKYGFRKTHKGELPKFLNKKVMLLGDSFTYGKGVSNHETFAFKSQENILKDSIEIINAGVEGRGTDYCLRAYQFYKEEYQPEVVVHFAHYNDLADNIREEYFTVTNDSTFVAKTFEKNIGGIKEKLQKNKPYNWLISNSHFFALLKRVLVENLMDGHQIEYDGNIDMGKAKHLTKIFYLQLKKEVEADGRKFITFYIPSNHDMNARGEGKLTDQESFFINFFTENNVTFHNFSENLLNSGIDKKKIVDYYYLPEAHWNKKAHQLISEQLKKDAYGFY